MANIFLEKAILRPMEKEDLSQLHKFRNDGEITKSLGGFSVGYSKEAVVRKIESWENQQDCILWAVANRKDNICIGHIGLYEIDFISRKAEVGMLIGEREYWGQGIGYAITQAVVNYAFNQLNLHRIQSKVLESNHGSLSIFEKLGFSIDGMLRESQFRDGKYLNVVLMSVLKREWLNTFE